MSYVRFSEKSDVYVYLDIAGYLCCCGCRLWPEMDRWEYYSTEDMIDHLKQHEAAGHKVPGYTYEGLREEQVENDQWMDDYAEGRVKS